MLDSSIPHPPAGGSHTLLHLDQGAGGLFFEKEFSGAVGHYLLFQEPVLFIVFHLFFRLHFFVGKAAPFLQFDGFPFLGLCGVAKESR